ncbi:MAG: PQQ-binding-like beta-propeller repeat protein [bacterium]|nr:PQQ-binding-like beta-propeller repeat protein [bacterium]
MDHGIERLRRRAWPAPTLLFLLCASLSAQTGSGRRRWVFPIEGTVVQSPAIGSDGTVYIGTGIFSDSLSADVLYAIRLDGTLKWKRHLGRAVHSSVSLDSEDNLYFIAGNPGTGDRMDAVVISFDSSGTTRWTSEPVGWMFPLPFSGFTPAVASDGTVYVCGRYSLFALRGDGTVKWRYDFPLREHIFGSGSVDIVGSHYSAPTVGPDGTVYVNTLRGGFGKQIVEGGVYAIRPDGALKWRTRDAGGTAAPIIGGDGTIYAAIGGYGTADSSRILAIRIDGTIRWTVETGLWIQASPSIGPDGTLYAGTSHHPLDVPAWFYAISPDGRVRWKYDTWDDVKDMPPARLNPPDIYNSPAVDSKGRVYFGNEIGLLYAMSPEGEVEWMEDIWSLHDQGPALAPDGTLIVATHSVLGLIALNTGSSGLADSSWPKFRRNNANTGNAGRFEPPGSVEPESGTDAFGLCSGFPNPFNPETTIEYRLPESGTVNLGILSVTGRCVAVLVNGRSEKGSRQVRWNGTDDGGVRVPSGVYLCRIRAEIGGNVYRKERKLCLVR